MNGAWILGKSHASLFWKRVISCTYPGDFMHVAEARDQVSLHLTVGIHPITVGAVISATVERANSRRFAISGRPSSQGSRITPLAVTVRFAKFVRRSMLCCRELTRLEPWTRPRSGRWCPNRHRSKGTCLTLQLLTA